MRWIEILWPSGTLKRAVTVMVLSLYEQHVFLASPSFFTRRQVVCSYRKIGCLCFSSKTQDLTFFKPYRVKVQVYWDGSPWSLLNSHRCCRWSWRLSLQRRAVQGQELQTIQSHWTENGSTTFRRCVTSHKTWNLNTWRRPTSLKGLKETWLKFNLRAKKVSQCTFCHYSCQ